jgi:dephospho-CoA kinase
VKCHVFGLTGGIGTGKSTVAARFRARRLPVFDADELSRAAVLPHTPGLEAVVGEFGRDVLATDGTLDRGKLGRIVFHDVGLRKRLEEIVHPFVRSTLEIEIRRLELREEPLACYEAPLLVETGSADDFRPLVVVHAPLDVQVVRSMHRDGVEEHHVHARLNHQAPASTKLRLADHVIDNTGELEKTIEEADIVLEKICRSLAIDPSRYPKPPPDAA